MIQLIPPQYRLLAVAGAALAVAAAGFGAGWTFQGWKSSAKLSQVQAEHSAQVRQAVKAERDSLASVLAEERALRAQSEGIANDARQRLDAVDAAAAGLAGERDRLRNDLRQYAATRTCAPGAAAGLAAGSNPRPAAGLVPGDVRDELLDQAAEALGQLAPALDTAHAKHTACAAVYEQARARLKRLGEAGRAVDAP